VRLVSEPIVVAIPNGQFQENCYLVADGATGEAAIVDPGEETAVFLAELERRSWRLTAIWLTHAHLDHVIGVAAIHRATGAPIHLHPADRPLYDSLPQQGLWFGMQLDPAPAPHQPLVAGQRLTVGSVEFTVRETPGHSPGSVSLVGPGVVLSGDALFAGSIGRTDLPGGDYHQLIDGIRRELLTLPDDTIVYSGHGPDTTIGEERRSNPFLQ
jgi:glyoxylase-like metal-dependent hydrolase (beta-lactamase superfamily II)